MLFVFVFVSQERRHALELSLVNSYLQQQVDRFETELRRYRELERCGCGRFIPAPAACPRCLGDLLWDSESVYDSESDVESE